MQQRTGVGEVARARGILVRNPEGRRELATPRLRQEGHY